jgi:hypothetical protein
MKELLHVTNVGKNMVRGCWTNLAEVLRFRSLMRINGEWNFV